MYQPLVLDGTGWAPPPPAPSFTARATFTSDSLTDFTTALGTVRDKSVGATWGMFLPLDDLQLNNAYSGSWLARKVIDIPAFDMVRKWRDWQADDDQIEVLEEEERRLQLRPKLTRGLKMARLFGGAALVMGIGGESPERPVEIDRVQKGGLKYLHVLTRNQITAGEIETDIASPFFGEPKNYSLTAQTGTMTTIHPSRVVRLIGAERIGTMRVEDGWGDSILDAVNEALKQALMSTQGVASLVQEAKVDVFKVPNLLANIAKADYRNRLLERVRLAHMAKGNYQALLMDAEELYEQKSVNFAQLPELMRLFLMVAAGAADIPATRLLGQSPDGMNATGESDLRNYYDRISAEQELSLRPALERLDEVMIRSAIGSRPAEVYYRFAPLWQISEKERADIFKTKADGARTLAGTGGTSPPLMPIDALSDALVNTLVEDGSLPGLEAAIEEFGTLAEQPEETQTDVEGAQTPPAKVAANDAAPRTLYVSRKLINTAEFIAWAKGQGFTNPESADELHATILYSRTPVDWMAMGDNWSGDTKGQVTVLPGGPRLVEPLGDKGAVVLMFVSSELQWRHMNMVEKGASHDYPEFVPHVTITYAAGDLDLSRVEPYRGKLVFGPEIFEEIKEAGSDPAAPFSVTPAKSGAATVK